ncbi:hypothetical protein [Burkholderia sp. AU31652]|uniref:hypothetical protein n=1 Tax=Burkholderia sp. AU31652 TaxID=2015354 RepID=UPI000B7AD416|nr:hypothetical protein [Burkholderia sp. AU31652]
MTHAGFRPAAEVNANAMAVTDGVPLLAWCVRSVRHCRCLDARETMSTSPRLPGGKRLTGTML